MENIINLINIVESKKDNNLFSAKKLIKIRDSQNKIPIFTQLSLIHSYSL
jgi:hypothetical protein